MNTRQELIDFCLKFPGVYEDYPFGNDAHADDGLFAVMRHRANKKSFALIYKRGGKLCINLKCDPLEAEFLRRTFKNVTPGWHMNKTHWNTVTMGGESRHDTGSAPTEELERMIGNSWGLTRVKGRKKT